MKQDYKWLYEVDSQALQASIKSVYTAFKNFFRGKGYPKYKSKKGTQTFQTPGQSRRIDFEKGLLTLIKIPNIPIKISRTFDGKIKRITISKTTTGKYYASFVVKEHKEIQKKKPALKSTAIGIDLGIKSLATVSDGTKIEHPAFLGKNLKRLKYLQRQLSRKRKGSNNYKKAKQKLALFHERIRNQRHDFLHKVSTVMVKQHDTLCFESLAIRKMVKNHQLARFIHDAAWGTFIRYCKYKMEWKGGHMLQLPPFHPSTKMCSDCGTLNDNLTLADREWICANCGSYHDRDHNAAKNIKQYFFKDVVEDDKD
jgi:putative transposase